MLIDTHNHLDFPSLSFFNYQANFLNNKSTTHHIIASVTQKNWQRIINLANSQTNIFYSLGIHPLFISEHQPSDLDNLISSTQQHNPIAIGECGLDFWQDEENKAQQLFYLNKQLEIATQFQLPVILHSRKANDLLFKTLKSYPKLTGVIHSFSGSLQQAEQLIKLGYYLGFGGAVTYQRAKRLRKVLTQLPKERILLETDAPDQPPSFANHHPNHPNNLYCIAEIIADIRQTDVVELISQCNQNAIKLFSLPLT